jgi:tetratricopeptide (TPR) repeat protein
VAATLLNDRQSRTEFLQERVVANLRFWRDYQTAPVADFDALDQEWEAMVRAISLGLDLEPAWPTVCQLVTTFSSFMERRGYWQTWKSVLNRALAVAQRVGDEAAEVTLSALLARLLQQQGRFKASIARYQRTIRLARRLGDRFNEARARSNLGFLYVEQGHWYRAEVLCCRALAIFEDIGSDHGRAHTENHLGFLYTRQCHWEMARRHLERACDLWQSMEDDHGLMRGCINLGVLDIEANRPDDALGHLEKALYQAKLTGEEAEMGTIYMNMGLAFMLKGELSQAETRTRQAQRIFDRFSNSLMIALVWANLGKICMLQEKWPEASHHLEATFATWSNLNHTYGKAETLRYLIECDLALGNQLQTWQRFSQLESLVRHNKRLVEYLDLGTFLEETRDSLTGQTPPPKPPLV